MSAELWMLLRGMLSLAVVLALAVVLLRFGLPRLSGFRAPRGQRQLNVVEVRPLDRQHRVALVEAEGRRFLVGFGPGGMTTIDGWPAATAARGPVAVDDEPAGERAAG